MPELITCPSCQRQLRVPESLFGKLVKCPSCQTTFTAQGGAAASGYQPPAAPPPAYQEPPPPRPSRREGPPYEEEEDYEDRGRPRRRRRRRGEYLEAHRGGMILTFGILSLAFLLICAPLTLVFGIMAWVMGASDLNAIRSGRMDPEGEGMTNGGKICGMISIILLILFCVCYAGFVFLGAAMDAGRPQRNDPWNDDPWDRAPLPTRLYRSEWQRFPLLTQPGGSRPAATPISGRHLGLNDLAAPVNVSATVSGWFDPG